MGIKGSRNRVKDYKSYRNNYDDIFNGENKMYIEVTCECCKRVFRVDPKDIWTLHYICDECKMKERR